MGILQVRDDFVFHVLLQMCSLYAELGRPIDDIDDQMEAGCFIQHRQFERRVDVAFFLVAAHMQVLMPLESIGELVDEPRVAMKVEDDRLIRGEQAVEIAFRRSMQMLRERPDSGG